MSKTTRPPSRKKVRSKGTLVCQVTWDNNMIAGEDEVYQLDGRFYHLNDEGELAGPFDTLDEADEYCGLFHVNSTTRTIDAPLLSAAEVVAMLRADPDDHDDLAFLVNGEDWFYDQGAKRFAEGGPDEEAGDEELGTRRGEGDRRTEAAVTHQCDHTAAGDMPCCHGEPLHNHLGAEVEKVIGAAGRPEGVIRSGRPRGGGLAYCQELRESDKRTMASRANRTSVIISGRSLRAKAVMYLLRLLTSFKYWRARSRRGSLRSTATGRAALPVGVDERRGERLDLTTAGASNQGFCPGRGCYQHRPPHLFDNGNYSTFCGVRKTGQ